MDVDYWELENQVLSAVRDGDRSSLDHLLADSFVITTAGWLREPADKGTWIDALSQHVLTEFHLHDVAVRLYGLVTVTMVHSTQTGLFHEAPYTHEFRYTDVWRCRGDDVWQLDVRHATLLPPAN